MNWRKGLLRLWMVASVLWVCAIGGVATVVLKAEFEKEAAAASKDNWWDKDEVAYSPPTAWEQLQGWAMFAVLPPGIVFLLGATGYWVAGGFKASKGGS